MRYFLISLFLVFLSAASASIYVWLDYASPSSNEQEVTLIVPRGLGFIKTLDLLAENKVINNSYTTKVMAYATGDARKIKAGEYRFPAAISPQQVIGMMVRGEVVVHKITIAEGLNVREVAELIKAHPVLEGEVPATIEEGSLLPETYHFMRGDSRASVIARMQEKMQQTLNELWENRADGLPLADKKQALILASIVEKETGLDAERQRVAAVFVNRLKINMRLQSDPTVVYGMEKQTGKPLGRPLTLNDIQIPTDYNTYTIPALPSGPIANPGREAIEATLHPLATNELYFVATGTGGHHFASTLAEHNKNVQEYRQKMKAQ